MTILDKESSPTKLRKGFQQSRLALAYLDVSKCEDKYPYIKEEKGH